MDSGTLTLLSHSGGIPATWSSEKSKSHQRPVAAAVALDRDGCDRSVLARTRSYELPIARIKYRAMIRCTA